MYPVLNYWCVSHTHTHTHTVSSGKRQHSGVHRVGNTVYTFTHTHTHTNTHTHTHTHLSDVLRLSVYSPPVSTDPLDVTDVI